MLCSFWSNLHGKEQSGCCGGILKAPTSNESIENVYRDTLLNDIYILKSEE